MPKRNREKLMEQSLYEEKEVLEAAEKLKDFCTGRNCLGCIFNIGYADCMLYDDEPCEWDLTVIDESEG